MVRPFVSYPVCAVVVTVMAVAGCGGGGGSSGPPKPDTTVGRLAFDSRRSAGIDLWTVRADGTDTIRVTSLASAESEPTWSPDGQTLAFISDNSGNPRLYRVPAKGGTITPIGSMFAGQPSWSPDGQWIAFSWAGHLSRIHPDGSGLVSIIDTLPSATNPAWSPDGKRIAFWDGSGTLSLIDPDGSHLRAVITVAAGLGQISWNPAGGRLAFAEADSLGFRSILAIDTTGANLQPLSAPYGSWNPAWSPDGLHLAFVRVLTTPVNPNGEIMVGDPSGAHAHVVASVPVDDEHPAWRP